MYTVNLGLELWWGFGIILYFVIGAWSIGPICGSHYAAILCTDHVIILIAMAVEWDTGSEEVKALVDAKVFLWQSKVAT